MSSSETENHSSHNDRRTKTELLEELQEQKKELQKMKIDNSAYIKEREKMQIQLDNARKEKNEALTTLQQSKVKFKQLEELQQINDKFEEEKEKLRTDLRAAEAIVDEQTAAREKEKGLMEKKIKSLEDRIEQLTSEIKKHEPLMLEKEKLENEVRELNKQLIEKKESSEDTQKMKTELAQLKEQITEQKKSQSATLPPSTFLLELEEKKGQISGSISHPSSNQKKEFNGIDGATILDFLANYHKAGSKMNQSKKLATVKEAFSEAHFPELSHVDVFAIDPPKPKKVLKHDEPFNVQLTLEVPNKDKTADINMRYKASIYAKSLASGQHILVGETEDTLKSDDSLDVNISSNILQPGLYQFEAALSYQLDNDRIWPISAYQESDLITIY